MDGVLTRLKNVLSLYDKKGLVEEPEEMDLTEMIKFRIKRGMSDEDMLNLLTEIVMYCNTSKDNLAKGNTHQLSNVEFVQVCTYRKILNMIGYDNLMSDKK